MDNTETTTTELPNQLPRPQKMDPDERLFRHGKKPDWGVGLWVREEKNRRRLRFEDGKMRSFRKGFYHMLVPVDSTRVDVDALYQQIATEHELLILDAQDAESAKSPVMAFEEQVMVFKELYPQGFSDPDYLDTYRAPPKGRSACKRHVDPIIANAQVAMAQPALKQAMDEGRHSDIHSVAVKLLDSTSLVTPTRLKLIANLPKDDHVAFAEALYGLLHGEGRYRERFEHWLLTLRRLSGSDMNWPVLTALPALMYPERHVILKARAYQLQARSVAPSERVKKKPTRRGYRKGRRVALATQQALKEAELMPRDLLDVSAFIWETLRPKGRKLLETMKETA